MSDGSERADGGGGESGGKQEGKDERGERGNEGSEMSSCERDTPVAGSFTGVGRDDEAKNVHLPD